MVTGLVSRELSLIGVLSFLGSAFPRPASLCRSRDLLWKLPVPIRSRLTALVCWFVTSLPPQVTKLDSFLSTSSRAVVSNEGNSERRQNAWACQPWRHVHLYYCSSFGSLCLVTLHVQSTAHVTTRRNIGTKSVQI